MISVSQDKLIRIVVVAVVDVVVVVDVVQIDVVLESLEKVQTCCC